MYGVLIYFRTSTLENRFLSDYSRLTQKWRVLTVFTPYPRPKAHTACILVEQATGEDKLLRSEMICAVSLIRGRMRLKEYKEHQIFPVRFFLAPRGVMNADD